MRPFITMLLAAGSAGLITAVLLAPVTEARQPTRATETEVTLVIFSGRVDPVWVLTLAQESELRNRLGHLPRAPEPFAAPRNLGYLRILLPDGNRRRQEILIDHGHVIWVDRKVLHMLTDPDRSLETWLLATGRGRTSEGERWFTINDVGK